MLIPSVDFVLESSVVVPKSIRMFDQSFLHSKKEIVLSREFPRDFMLGHRLAHRCPHGFTRILASLISRQFFFPRSYLVVSEALHILCLIYFSIDLAGLFITISDACHDLLRIPWMIIMLFDPGQVNKHCQLHVWLDDSVMAKVSLLLLIKLPHGQLQLSMCEVVASYNNWLNWGILVIKFPCALCVSYSPITLSWTHTFIFNASTTSKWISCNEFLVSYNSKGFMQLGHSCFIASFFLIFNCVEASPLYCVDGFRDYGVLSHAAPFFLVSIQSWFTQLAPLNLPINQQNTLPFSLGKSHLFPLNTYHDFNHILLKGNGWNIFCVLDIAFYIQMLWISMGAFEIEIMSSSSTYINASAYLEPPQQLYDTLKMELQLVSVWCHYIRFYKCGSMESSDIHLTCLAIFQKIMRYREELNFFSDLQTKIVMTVWNNF